MQEGNAPRTKKLYFLELKKRVDACHAPLLDFLARLQLLHAKTFGLSNTMDTIEINNVVIPSRKAWEFLQLIKEPHVLFFQKERIHVESRKKASFYFLVSPELEVEGMIFWEGEDFSVRECRFFLPSEKMLFLWKNKLGSLETAISWKWLQILQKGNYFLKNSKELEEEYDPLDPLAPRIRLQKKEAKAVEILPVLILSDSSCSFASLWFSYQEERVSFFDPTSVIKGMKRKKDEEARFEKDILEAGFQKRGAEYFCPTDKSGDALQLLLEVGWKVEDAQKRSLIPLSSYQLAIQEKEGEILLEGDLVFNDASCSLEEAFSHLKGKTSLLGLGEKKAALLHPKLLEKILHLKERPTSLKIPRSKLSSFQSLLQDKKVAWEEKVRHLAEGLSGAMPSMPAFLSPFQADLYPYQKEGMRWLYFLYQHGLGGILADEMGLGKTIQILAFFACLRTNLPILVVTPSSLIYNWKAEIERFLPKMAPYLHLGKERSPAALEGKQLILTTYPLLRQDEEVFKELSFSCVVLDESSAIKNDSSLTAKVAYGLKAESKFALNGTPIENSYDELWSQFHFVQPDLLGEKKSFLKNIGDIKHKIRPFFLKRTKDQVEVQLPPKFEQVVWVEMEEEESLLYERFREDAVRFLEEGEEQPLKILEKILRLRQILCHPLLLEDAFSINKEIESAKFQLFLNDIDALYEQKSKVLIYSQFTKMLKLMKGEFERKGYRFLYLDGETPLEERQKHVGSFQKDKDQLLFLISLKAGGVGLTLTAADYVILYDPWWNEAVEEQAANRAHRIGRDKSLIIKKYLTLHSLEENMLALKKHKSMLAQNLQDNASLSLTKEDWLHLLR